MARVVDLTALGSAEETVCGTLGGTHEQNTNGRLWGLSTASMDSVRNMVKNKPCGMESAVESLPLCSSWFCACVCYWWTCMHLCYTVKPIQGRMSAGKGTQCMSCACACQCKEPGAGGDSNGGATVRGLLSWEVILGSGHTGGMNS